MTSKKYHYTLYNQDGSSESWTQAKMDFTQIKEVLGHGCSMIEIIPKDYQPDDIKKSGTVYGDEEGRFNSTNIRNPHFKVLTDSDGGQWDCVGNLLHEKVAK